MNETENASGIGRTLRARPDLVYAFVLLATAVALVAVTGADGGLLAGDYGWRTAAFFVVFGLFTIATGFPHPVFGHVSFDRVSQVASILVLGPVDAAWVNGLASLVYPWYRLRSGVPLSAVLTASLHNAGLMILVVLAGALLYRQLGGPIPLGETGLDAMLPLLALVVAMQLVNDLGMMVVVHLRGGDPWQVFSRFTTVVEFVSAAAGVVLAVAFTSASLSYFILLLVVLATGMLVIMQYALMRDRLEKLVEERTEALRVQAREFERQATHDKLTGLPNRRHADSYLQEQVDLVTQGKRQGVVALADIDHFKSINDSHSHAVGDQVLEQVARIFGDGCRKTDFVARYGGEEFLFYFPDTPPADAHRVCTGLRLGVQDADWSAIATDLEVTVSFGIAGIRDDSRFTTVLNEADMRLYRAKREGRNRVVSD